MKLKQISRSLLLAVGVVATGAAQAAYVEIDSANVKFFYDADFWGLNTASVTGDSIAFNIASDFTVSAKVRASATNGQSDQQYSDGATPGVIAVAKTGYRLQSYFGATVAGNFGLSANGGYVSVGAYGSVTEGSYSGGNFTAGNLLGFYGSTEDHSSTGVAKTGAFNTTTFTGNLLPTVSTVGVDSLLTSYASQGGPGLSSSALTKVSYEFAVVPVPEPETYAMLLAGLGLVGAIARRRRKTKA
jgi:hypothetical protein